MDAIISLYGSSAGRIPRKTFWLGILGLIVASLLLGIVLSLFGLNMTYSLPQIDPANPDFAAAIAAAEEASRAGAWGTLVTVAIFAWPTYNLMVKRRHDRNNRGLDVAIYMGLTVLLLLVQALGLGMDRMDIGGATIPVPSAPLSLALAGLGIFAIYLLVVCGFLGGTAGPNRYGPDPRGAPAGAAA